MIWPEHMTSPLDEAMRLVDVAIRLCESLPRSLRFLQKRFAREFEAQTLVDPLATDPANGFSPLPLSCLVCSQALAATKRRSARSAATKLEWDAHPDRWSHPMQLNCQLDRDRFLTSSVDRTSTAHRI